MCKIIVSISQEMIIYTFFFMHCIHMQHMHILQIYVKNANNTKNIAESAKKGNVCIMYVSIAITKIEVNQCSDHNNLSLI